MNYMVKRNNAHIKKAYMANKLGMRYGDYIDVEHLKRALEGDKLQIFLDVCNNKLQHRIEQNNDINAAREMFEAKSIVDYFNEFNITNKTFADYAGFKPASVSGTKRMPLDKMNENTMLIFYYYFKDGTNKLYEVESKKKKNVQERNKMVPFNEKEIEELVGKKSNTELADITESAPSSISYYRKKGLIPKHRLDKIKEYAVKDVTDVDNIVEVSPAVEPVEEVIPAKITPVESGSKTECVEESKDATIERLKRDLHEAKLLIRRYEYLIDKAASNEEI